MNYMPHFFLLFAFYWTVNRIWDLVIKVDAYGIGMESLNLIYNYLSYRK